MKPMRHVWRVTSCSLVLAGTLVLNPSSAQAGGYTITKIAALGDAAPGSGGAVFVNDFEVGQINDWGAIAFTSEIPTGEGLFLSLGGQVSAIALPGQAAPGGGTYFGGIWATTSVNDVGDVAFTSILTPFTLPVGANAGLFRYSILTRTITAGVIPYVTPAPKGGTFQGTYGPRGMNNLGEVVFSGVVPTTQGISGTLGTGVFKMDRAGHISNVASPGDGAPGGGTFDFAQNPWINNWGDIAFGGHVAGEACVDETDQSVNIFCAESVYLKSARTGQIISIAHQGDAAPGGGTYRLAFGPVLNDFGQMVFVGDLSPASAPNTALAVFTWAGGKTSSVARPGDAMPGGGHFAKGPDFIGNYHINDFGLISFTAALDNGDQGVYVRAPGGTVKLVAKTGTVIPGVGTFGTTEGFLAPGPSGGAVINNLGQVLFAATMTSGKVALLVATPAK